MKLSERIRQQRVDRVRAPWLWDIMPCELRADDDAGTVLLRCTIHHEPSEANARLIAAAPELLEALSDLVEIEDRDNRTDPSIPASDAWRLKAWNNAREAIRKAKGE